MSELGIPPGIVSADALIEIDGETVARLNSGLLSVLVEETTEGLYRCETRFGNWGSGDGGPDYLYFDRTLLDFGKEIAVRLGADEGAGEVFRGRISALEAQFSVEDRSLTVLAEDRAQDLRMQRRTRVFEDLSDADVFTQIAGEHGLQAAIDVNGPTQRVLAQINQSDLAFIRERARWLDAEVWLADRTLHVQSRASRQQDTAGDLTLILGRGLLEFEVSADLANQHTSVIVSGWDVSAKDQLSHEANDSVLGSELHGMLSAAGLVDSAFGTRTDRLVHHMPLTIAEAQSLAEATFRTQARRFVHGVGVARGDARIRVGALIRMRGLGELFSGDYYVSEVRHMFQRGETGGYTTQFVAERPGLGRG
jgi:phage protein D